MKTTPSNDNTFAVSVEQGVGMSDFLAALEQRVAERLPAGADPLITRQRHRLALEKVVTALERYEQAPTPELAAEDLRLAVRGLGEIMGQVDVEDLLDIIFADFCIGK